MILKNSSWHPTQHLSCNNLVSSHRAPKRRVKPTGQISRSGNLNCRSRAGAETPTTTEVWSQLIVQSSQGKEINWRTKHIKKLKLALACYEIIGSPKDWEVYFCFVYKSKLKSTTSALSLKISKLGSIFLLGLKLNWNKIFWRCRDFQSLKKFLKITRE